MSSHGVEYLIVGAHAVAFHGYPRYTGDVDVWVRRSPENADRIIRVLEAFGFGTVALGQSDFLAEGRVVQLGNPPNRIDLLTSITAVGFDEAWKTRVEGLLDGVPVAFVSREILLRNKRATGRAKDRADAEEISKLQS